MKINFYRDIKNIFNKRNLVDKKMNIYKKRKLLSNKNQNKVNIKDVIFVSIILISFIYIHLSKYSIKSMYIAIFLILGLMFYLLIIDRIIENRKIENEFMELKKERNREYTNFLDKVKEIEELEKNQIKEIILKNEKDYDIKKWEIGRRTSLVIGKDTVRHKVDIDLSESEYSVLVSRIHGVLNRVNGIWFYEDLGSQNGSGILKKESGQKFKVERNRPVKVVSGDVIYTPITKILLK